MSTAQSSTYKFNEANANAQSRYHFLKVVQQLIKQESIYDKRSKTDCPLKVFELMLQYYIPKNGEMQRSPKGNLHFRGFSPIHYSQNAKYLVNHYGFEESKIPRHQVKDDTRNCYRQVSLNSWGNIIDPDNDETIQLIIEIISTFPRKLISPAMTAIAKLINSVHEPPVIFDKEELLSPLLWLQRFQANLIKTCIANQQTIRNHLTLLTKTSLHSINDLISVRDKSIPAIELWEVATLSLPTGKQMDYIQESISFLTDMNTKYPTESDRSRVLKQLEKVNDVTAAAGRVTIEQFFEILSGGFVESMFDTLPSNHRQVEHALVAEPSTKPKPGFIKPAPVEKVIYDTKSECGQLREMLKAHVTEFHDYIKQQQSQAQARNGKRKWNQNGSKGQGDGKDKGKENHGSNKQPSKHFAGLAEPRRKRIRRPAASRPQESEESSGGEEEYGGLAICGYDSDDDRLDADRPVAPGAQGIPVTDGSDATVTGVMEAAIMANIMEIRRTTMAGDADVAVGAGGADEAGGAGGATMAHDEPTPTRLPSNYGLQPTYHHFRPVPNFSEEHHRQTVIRLWRAGIWGDPIVTSLLCDTIRKDLSDLISQYQSLQLNLRVNQAIQQVAVDILTGLGKAGIYTPSSGMRARLWATKKYISFVQELDGVPDLDGALHAFKDLYEEGFPSIFDSLGFTGAAAPIWADPEWEFTDFDPSDEQTSPLMVDWYFETLDVTLSLNDHRCIRQYAQEFFDGSAGLGASGPMEARLFGLRMVLHPSPSASPDPTPDPVASIPAIKPSASTTGASATIVKKIKRGKSTLYPPASRRGGPVTRRATLLASYNYPEVTLPSDSETSSPARSGHIESGGELLAHASAATMVTAAMAQAT